MRDNLKNRTKPVGFWLTTLLVGSAAFVPYLLLFVWSLAQNWRFPDVLPNEFSFRAWEYLFAPTSGVQIALSNSILLALIVSILAVLVAIPAARAMALHDFRGKKFVFFLILLPILTPSIIVAIGGHALFLRLSLTDTFFGVILAHLIPTVPYTILTLISSFARLDTDLEAQARTLGASTFNVWRYVIFPAILPGIAVSATFAFLISWSQYLPTLLVGGGSIKTLPLMLVAFQRGSDIAATSALTLIFLIPTLFLFIVSAKFLRQSMND